MITEESSPPRSGGGCAPGTTGGRAHRRRGHRLDGPTTSQREGPEPEREVDERRRRRLRRALRRPARRGSGRSSSVALEVVGEEEREVVPELVEHRARRQGGGPLVDPERRPEASPFAPARPGSSAAPQPRALGGRADARPSAAKPAVSEPTASAPETMWSVAEPGRERREQASPSSGRPRRGASTSRQAARVIAVFAGRRRALPAPPASARPARAPRSRRDAPVAEALEHERTAVGRRAGARPAAAASMRQRPRLAGRDERRRRAPARRPGTTSRRRR